MIARAYASLVGCYSADGKICPDARPADSHRMMLAELAVFLLACAVLTGLLLGGWVS